MLERFGGFYKNLFAKAVPQENALAQPQRITLGVQRLDIHCRICPRHAQAHRIRARVNCGDMNWLGHLGIYRQRCASAADGVYFVARIPNPSPILNRSCLFTCGTLASPSSSMKPFFFAITSNSRLIIV